jgi:hypothetical protein
MPNMCIVYKWKKITLHLDSALSSSGISRIVNPNLLNYIKQLELSCINIFAKVPNSFKKNVCLVIYSKDTDTINFDDEMTVITLDMNITESSLTLRYLPFPVF